MNNFEGCALHGEDLPTNVILLFILLLIVYDLFIIVVSFLKVTQYILSFMKLYFLSFDICKQCLPECVFEHDVFHGSYKFN